MTVFEFTMIVGMLANISAIIWVGRRNSTKLGSVLVDVHKIELATNSMKDELVATTRKGALAEGKKSEKDDQAVRDKRSASKPRTRTSRKRT